MHVCITISLRHKLYDITIHTDTVQEDQDSSPSTGRRGRGSRGRGRGRGSSGRGRGTASHLGGGFTPSTLAWEEVDSATDTAPSSLPFTRTSESTVTLDPTASPVQFLDHFLDEDILGLVLDETNK